MAVGANLPYNIMLLPSNLDQAGEDDGWVAVAREGVSGLKNQEIAMPDLILTRGAFISGIVTDKTTGEPLAGVHIGDYGPARPASSAAIIGGLTDANGHYHLRVAPGKNQTYVADDRFKDGAEMTSSSGTIDAGHTVTANFQVTPK